MQVYIFFLFSVSPFLTIRCQTVSSELEDCVQKLVLLLQKVKSESI